MLDALHAMDAFFLQQTEAGQGHQTAHEAARERGGDIIHFALRHDFPRRDAHTILIDVLRHLFLRQQVEPDRLPQGTPHQEGMEQSQGTKRRTRLAAGPLGEAGGKRHGLVHLLAAEAAGHVHQQEQGLLRIVQGLFFLGLEQDRRIARGHIRQQTAIRQQFCPRHRRELEEGGGAVQPESFMPLFQIGKAGLSQPLGTELCPFCIIPGRPRRLGYGLQELEQGNLFQRVPAQAPHVRSTEDLAQADTP